MQFSLQTEKLPTRIEVGGRLEYLAARAGHSRAVHSRILIAFLCTKMFQKDPKAF